jgi:hypothetical protein
MPRRQALASLLLIGALALLPESASAVAARQVLLYDPDANLSDIVEIAAAFSRYLQRTGENWTFQAVQQRDAFEALLKQPSSEYAIVSAAYLRASSEFNMTPLLVPSHRGDVYYRKQLVTSKKVEARSLSGRNIAVSGAGDERSAETQAVLAELARAGVDKPLLVSLPKDIDALMALYFGQADAALVVPNSIEVMRRITPKAVASLEVLHETHKMLRSPLCAVGKNSASRQKEFLVQYLQGMAADPDGKEIMRRMAFDAWAPFQSDMLR